MRKPFRLGHQQECHGNHLTIQANLPDRLARETSTTADEIQCQSVPGLEANFAVEKKKSDHSLLYSTRGRCTAVVQTYSIRPALLSEGALGSGARLLVIPGPTPLEGSGLGFFRVEAYRGRVCDVVSVVNI